ncbi:unnamed protein product [Diamesa tonsa]
MASKEDKPDENKSSSASSANEKSESSISLEKIRQYLSDKLKFSDSDNEEDHTDGRHVLSSVNLQGVIDAWKRGAFKNIVTMVGAGISTSAGIPDFRSPKSGLYHNLKKFNLPYPEAIFDLDYFKDNPQPFFKLAKDLWPGKFKPTPSHYFCKILETKGLLLRHYTQNIDTLERIAGISDEKLVEAHGTFYTNHCVKCNKDYSMEWAKEQIFADSVPTCTDCNSIVKPDIVFFGENLPEKFHQLPNQDFKHCDLLIIMGTSLTVQPFATLVDYASDHCVRLLINRDKVGKVGGSSMFRSMLFGEGLCFDLPGNRRDVAYEGDCDEGCFHLADSLGFGDELRDLIKREHDRIDKEDLENGLKVENPIDDTKEEPSVTEDPENDDESKEKLLKDEDTKQSKNEA